MLIDIYSAAVGARLLSHRPSSSASPLGSLSPRPLLLPLPSPGLGVCGCKSAYQSRLALSRIMKNTWRHIHMQNEPLKTYEVRTRCWICASLILHTTTCPVRTYPTSVHVMVRKSESQKSESRKVVRIHPRLLYFITLVFLKRRINYPTVHLPCTQST